MFQVLCEYKASGKDKLTIDNEQLTIMVSLRDKSKLFILFERNALIVNCQLSIVNLNIALTWRIGSSQRPLQVAADCCRGDVV